jgi:hypothetical protein
MKNPTRRQRILERVTRPFRKRAYNKRRDRTIVSNYKWENDMPKLDASFNPLADDEHVCFFPPPEVPPKWDDEAQKDKFFDREPSEVEKFLQRVKKDLKKKKFVNPGTGRLDMRYNPLAVDDGCCFPVRREPHPSWYNDEERMDDLENHKLDTRYNPLANDEDFFIPVRAA